MTTKELLYLEDALGHEKYFQTKCSETANQIQDADLKSCVQQMAQKHQQIFQSFYGFFFFFFFFFFHFTAVGAELHSQRKRILPIEFLDVPKPHKFAVCARKECL